MWLLEHLDGAQTDTENWSFPAIHAKWFSLVVWRTTPPPTLFLNSLQMVVVKLRAKINLFIAMTSSYIHPITTVIRKAVAADIEYQCDIRRSMRVAPKHDLLTHKY